MANRKTRLELTWIGKENRPKLEPRVLIEDPAKSYHAAHRVSEDDIFDNRLIFGDNLLALKALEQEFLGGIKCIYIDPPFNTGSAFLHYEDGVEHSLWLSLMKDRLELLWHMLRHDGVIWLNIDDHEGHYLKVLCDEVFGRDAFVTTVVWENFYGRSNAAAISPSHNYLLVYAPTGLDWKNIRNLLPRGEKSSKQYKNPDDDPKGSWRLGPIFAAEERHEGLMYTITTPSGREVKPPPGSHWRMTEPEFWSMVESGRITFGESGNNIPALKLYLSEVQDGLVPRTWWPHTDAGHTQEAKRELQALFSGETPFDTPKPERLLRQIVQISTNPGDWVLDSFAGSGTTGAVAHKLGRRWIMVELGDHAQTHIVPRMRQVIDGTDTGGISAGRTLLWEEKITVTKLRQGESLYSNMLEVQEGASEHHVRFERKVEDNHLRLYGIDDVADIVRGGGFRYYKLGPTLIVEDEWGNPVINPEFNAGMLTEAMCMLEGFTFDPNAEVYWQQGRSSETDFIYVTTQFMSKDMLTKISDEVGPNRSLLICCSAFRCDVSQFENLTVKKIPKVVLKKCEWGHDDYSLEIENLPDAPPEVLERQEAEAADNGKPVRKFGKDKGQMLFDLEEADAKGGK